MRDQSLWTVQATALDTIQVTWKGADNVNLYWGDGTAPVPVGLNTTKSRRYESLGAYRIRARNLQQQVVAETVVVIRSTLPQVQIERADGDLMTVVVRAPSDVDDTGIIPYYQVDFGRTDKDWFWGWPGASWRHTFDKPGRTPIRVTDMHAHTEAQKVLHLEARSLDFTLAAQGREATLTVTQSKPGKELVVAWGDVTAPEPVTGRAATHTYPPDVDGTYLVQLAYTDGSDAAADSIAIPGGQS